MGNEKSPRRPVLELKNNVTQQLDVEGYQVRFHENPGITVVQLPAYRDIAVVWFNDPTEKGLFTLEGLAQYEAQLDILAQDSSIAGLILTGNLPEDGKVSFYGVNVKDVFGPIFEALSNGNSQPMEELLRIGQRVSEKKYTFPKPLVGGVRRLAVGGGFEFMIPTSHIVQGKDAAYSLPECQLDVPKFVQKRFQYELQLGNPNYQSGSVLFPGWIGNVLLYNKLIETGMPMEDAVQEVEDFTFNGKRLSASEAHDLRVADATVESDKDIIARSVEYINQVSFIPKPNNLLSLPNQRPTNPATYDTPGKVAGATLLYVHQKEMEPYSQVGERAVKLMVNAMWHGLSVDGPLPYEEYSHLFRE